MNLTPKLKNTKPYVAKPNTVVITESPVSNESLLKASAFIQLGQKEEFRAGEIIFEENNPADCLYLIVEGEAEVYMETTDEFGRTHQHVLAHLKKKDIVGDMALIEEKARSACLRAKTALTMLRFPIDVIKNHPKVNLLVTNYLARKLSERLRHTNQVTIRSMKESLYHSLARNALGSFMIALFWLLSVYSLLLTSLISYRHQLSSSTPLSVAIIFVIAVALIIAMRYTGLPWATFGITLKDWRRKTLQAILYSLPLMFLILVIKAYFVYFSANPYHVDLFSGIDEFTLNGHFFWQVYLEILLLYSIFSPIQELATRAGMQSTFFLFLPGNERFRKWNAIVLSNLIFAAAHSHMSLPFAMLAFVSGLFWGWLFHKQRSLLAVSVSHILLGVWAGFIVGVVNIT